MPLFPRHCLFDLWGFFSSSLLFRLAEKAQNRSILPKLKILRREAALPFAQRKKLAQERLALSIGHAASTVPYYKDLFASMRFKPENIRRDARYLQDLPYLTKDIIREQGRRLISEPYADHIVREQKTGSSTGLAATVYYDQESLDWTAAQNILMLQWGGKRCYNREAHLSTRFKDTCRPQYPDFEAKKCLVLNRYNIYTSGFDDTSQEVLLKDLHRACARIVQGHPSSLFALARYLKKKKKNGTGLFDIFVSTGEMLTDAQRDLIEEQLDVYVSNRYGACEFGVMAQERKDGPKGCLMISDSLVWPEIHPLDDKKKQADSGELVFTNLRNPVMPLIRYRMGDIGTLQEKGDGWWLSQMCGRTHDCVEIEGISYPTHHVQDILDRCGPIADFQILVKNEKAVELRMVAEEENWDGIAAAVQTNFPSLPFRRITAQELVFVGIRGKFSYLLREDA